MQADAYPRHRPDITLNQARREGEGSRCRRRSADPSPYISTQNKLPQKKVRLLHRQKKPMVLLCFVCRS